jgi:hypothetical protein
MKTAIKIGKKLNKFLKSYGSTFYFIRKPIVKFLGCIIAQIDEEEYQRSRNTLVWRNFKNENGK